MAAAFSIFPLEIWFLIFQYLRDDESPQHISRLAQTCQPFHQELNHLLYQPIRLRRVENAQRFANTVSSRPDLAALVKEVRHTQDAGFSDFAGYSEPFYKVLTELKNLETLVMRETTHPIYEYSPQAAVQEALAEICYDAQVSGVRGSCLNDIIRDMEGLGYPLGNASDPLGLGFHPRMIHSIECWAEDLIERTYFSRGNLKDLMPALRTCHIGTDSDLNPIPQRDSLPCILFNETIFTLPNLQKLCITGAIFREFGLEETSVDNRAANLTELLLLNCRVSAEDLALIIRFPRALKRLTIRVPLSLEAPYQEDDYTVFSDQLSALHSKSLEYVDADIYGGADYGLGFDSFEVLKEVILTPPSMLANVDEEMILPDSVQKLTIRYEEGTLLHLSPLLDDLKDGNLHNLRSVICQIPDNICEFTTNLEPCVEVAAFKPEFKDFGVELSIEFVPYPLTMPKYDVCPCENLTFYHQFPFHPRARSGPQDEQAANTTVAN